MPNDPEISRQVHVAFESGDVENFSRLLGDHPEFLRHPDGTDRWMWQAAMKGDLAIVKALFDQGVDVNESKDLEDRDDPFSQAEGAVLWAASEGKLETVRWLLAHGARLNYSVNGKTRCLPLQFAATNGHLDVVKLLVESGADWRSSWNGLDAISQADNYGHSEVRDYLKSLDAKDPT